MNNTEKLYATFSSALNLDLNDISDDLTYQSVPQWDSISHMALIVELEQAFQVSLDATDVINISNVAKAKEILVKYNIDFSHASKG